MYQSTYDNNLMPTPDYATSLTGDFYIEPVALETGTATQDAAGASVVTVRKGDSVTRQGYTVTFVGFEMAPKDAKAMTSSDAFPVGATLRVKRGAQSEELTAVSMFAAGKQPETRIVYTSDQSLGFEFLRMNINTEGGGSSVELRITEGRSAPAQSQEVLVVEASVKPVMSLVWLAATFVMLGLAVSIVNSVKPTAPPTEKPSQDDRVRSGESREGKQT